MDILPINYEDSDVINRLDETVHDIASKIASDINNQGQWVDYLLSNGWTHEQINNVILGNGERHD